MKAFAFLLAFVKWVFRTLMAIAKTAVFMTWKIVVQPILIVLLGTGWLALISWLVFMWLLAHGDPTALKMWTGINTWAV